MQTCPNWRFESKDNRGQTTVYVTFIIKQPNLISQFVVCHYL